jgi:hypothetical protein
MNTAVWSHVLEHVMYNCTKNFQITAKQIKDAKYTWTGKKQQFEPRLLAYQPSSSSRPQCFKENNVNIFPIKNGVYVLTRTNIYQHLDYSITSNIVHVRKNIDSHVLNIGDSETSHINQMRYSGIFERPEILGESILYGPLLSGRHRCSMDIELDGEQLVVNGVQFETDSCYETENKVLVIEAKNQPQMMDSFNIRQLYNPFRVLHKQTKKEIVCVFIHKINALTHVWKYTFDNLKRIDSIKLLGHYVYQIE